MTIVTATAIWNVIANFTVAGLSFAFVARKMSQNAKKRRET